MAEQMLEPEETEAKHPMSNAQHDEARTTITSIGLNQAFGFATIVAALDVVRTTLAVPLWKLQGDTLLFFTYFFMFRIKMYLDDSNHQFSDKYLLDIGIALASWILFLISVSAVGAGLEVAMTWFMLAMVVSTFWVIVARYMNGCDNRKGDLYVWFFGLNLLHIAGLGLALTYRPALIALIVLVIVDWMTIKRWFQGPAIPK